MAEFERWTRIQIVLAVPRMPLHDALAHALKIWPYAKDKWRLDAVA